MKYFDQHVHTRFSPDSKEEPENYLKKATENSVPVFVSTEHLEFNWDNRGEDWFPDFSAQIDLYRDLSEKYPSVCVNRGVEIGYKGSRVKETVDILDENKFSLVNLSVHDYNGYDLYNPELAKKFSCEEFLTGNFKTILEAVYSDIPFDTLCHIDYAFRTALIIDPSHKISAYKDILKDIFSAVIGRNKAIEVNQKVQRRIGSREHLDYLLDLYFSLGGKLITLSTDAHKVENYLEAPSFCLDIIREHGFDSLCFFHDHKPTLVSLSELF